MPGKKPFVRRFGQVDFDSMIALPGAAADDADIFVTRRGAFGANRTLTRAQIIAGAGVVPDPLLLNDGVVGAPSYSFTSDPDTGIFLDGAGILALTTGGFKIAQTQDGGAGARQFIVAPTTFQNNPAAPSLAFGDGDTGFFESADDNLVVSIAGANKYFWAGNVFGGLIGTSGAVLNEIVSAVNPTLVPNRSDLDTGLGQSAVNKLSLIAFGIEVARADTIAGPVSQFIIAPGIVQNLPATPSLAFGDGDTGFFEAADDVLGVAIAGVQEFQFITGALLGPDGTNLAPTYSFVDDPDTGIFTGFANVLDVTLGGVRSWTFQQSRFHSQTGNGPQLLAEASTNTNPTIIPHQGSDTSGLGGIVGQPSLIAGGLSCMSVSAVGAVRRVGFYDGSPIALQTGVAVTTAAVHAALVNLRLITA